MSHTTALLLLCTAVPGVDPPELILHHGKIVTVDPQFRIAEALAVRGERIVAVGSNADVVKLAGEGTRQIDLAGATVIPGLIDSHVHPVGAAMYEYDHPVPHIQSISDLLAHIRERAEALEDGEWIGISQVFITRLNEQRYPTRQELDEAAPKNPVVFATGPDSVLNSLALKESGIGKDYKVSDGGTGRVELDAKTGEPTGILRSCGRLIKSKRSGKSASREDELNRLHELLEHYVSVGLTSICDRGADPGEIESYDALRKENRLPCRVFMNAMVDSGASLEAINKRLAELQQHPLHVYNNRLWLRAIKLMLDGGMLTGSAYMREPWGVSTIYSISDPQYRGLRFIEQEKLTGIVRLAMQHELQPTAHSVGDGAVHALIDAYTEVNKEFPVRPHRPCVTHCNFMSREAIEQMKQIGIVCDLQPAWLWLDGRTLLRQFGDERLTYFQPYKTLFDEGVPVGGGSDHMQKMDDLRSINPYNPFLGMWITLARQPRFLDAPLHPEQRLNRAQALRLYTINNAFLTFEEKEKGSLEPGKLADFAVLEQDLLEGPEDDVRNVKVRQTYVGGKLVFERK